MSVLSELYGEKVIRWEKSEPGSVEYKYYATLFQLTTHNAHDHVIDFDTFMGLNLGQILAFQQFYRLLVHFTHAIADWNENPMKVHMNGNNEPLPELGNLVRYCAENIITIETIYEIYGHYQDLNVRIGYLFSAEDSRALENPEILGQ